MTNHLIADNIAKVSARIRIALQACDRPPNSVQLMAVSKTRTAADIRQAVASGIGHVGENYLQEGLEKMGELVDLPICWHFIGPIQANKTRSVAEHFDWVHTVARVKIARRLNQQRPAHLPPLQVCLQVNIDGEATKSGVDLRELDGLAETINTMPRLQLRGLMAIPRACEDVHLQRNSLAQVRVALQKLQGRYPAMDTLSMGMSADLEAAIAEGSTVVRIGTDIFGPR